jgi:hypothetical protein
VLPASGAALVILLGVGSGARSGFPSLGFLCEHLRSHSKIDGSTFTKGLSSDFLEISSEVSSDPVRYELAFSSHIHAFAFDRHPGGVVEPHPISMLADSVDQTVGNRVVVLV